jgi:hypothetical protein
MRKLLLLILLPFMVFGQNQRTRDLNTESTANAGYWTIIDYAGWTRSRKMSINVLTGLERKARYQMRDSIIDGTGLDTDFTYDPDAGSNYLKNGDFVTAGKDPNLYNADIILDSVIHNLINPVGVCYSIYADSIYSCTDSLVISGSVVIDTNLIIGRTVVGNIGNFSLNVGTNNQVSSTNSAVIGISNKSTNVNTFIAGGSANIASGANTFIGGGNNITNAGQYSGILGGQYNSDASGAVSSGILGGTYNTLTTTVADRSAIAGGFNNDIQDSASFIGGGSNNTVSSYQSAIIGGLSNTVSSYRSAIAGGNNNTASGIASFIAGGTANSAENFYGAILSSSGCTTKTNVFSSIIAGSNSTSAGANGVILGGTTHSLTSSASNSVIIGGSSRTLSVSNSVAVPNLYVDDKLVLAGTTATSNMSVDGQGYIINAAASTVTMEGLLDGTTGQVLKVVNTNSGGSIVLVNNGTGTKKILTSTGANVTISGIGGAELFYDGTNWILISSEL